MSACPCKGSDFTSCYEQVRTSKITDLVMLIVFTALVIIGTLAYAGVFGNAASLAYGMYAGAGVLFIVLSMRVICFHPRTERIGDTSLRISSLVSMILLLL